MSTLRRVISIIVVLVAAVDGLTYISWTLNGSRTQIPVTTSLESDIGLSTVISHSEMVIPSEYDKTIDLLTGNNFKQPTPQNLSDKDFNQFTHLVRTNWSSYDQKMGKPMMAWAAREVNTPSKQAMKLQFLKN
jgi:hypothetical protein